MKETLPYILDLRMFRWLQPKTPKKYSYQMVVSLMTDESHGILIPPTKTHPSCVRRNERNPNGIPASLALLKLDGNSKKYHNAFGPKNFL